MPRLEGVETAIRLRALQPWLQIALQSSDLELLSKRADGFELTLFDKIDFVRLLDWVERQAKDAHADGSADGSAWLAPVASKVDLCCSGCGYGIVSHSPPTRCPMCGGDASWVESRGWSSRRAALLPERLAG
jgi:hypothetical protein